jgi:hypothetical protein
MFCGCRREKISLKPTHSVRRRISKDGTESGVRYKCSRGAREAIAKVVKVAGVTARALRCTTTVAHAGETIGEVSKA